MFIKLDRTFEKPPYAITNPLKTFKNDDGKGIDYKQIWTPQAEKIYGILPKKYWPDFHLSVMTIDCEVPPHTDTEIVTSINFYLQTEGCKTTFYKVNVDNPKSVQIKNQTNGHIYFKEDLNEIGSFIAKDFEIWVLDVTQVHGVQGNFNLRKAITLGTFIHNYNDTLNILRENNNVFC